MASLSRTERGRETATSFVDAALRLVAEGGLEGLTIGRLAKDLGYAVGTLYRHFPGKGALLAAMQARVVAGLEEDLARRDARLPAEGDAPERARTLASLLAAARAYAELAGERPQEFGLLSMTLGDPRELVQLEEGGPVVPMLGELAATIGERFDRAAACGALDPGEGARRALVMWASLHGVLQLRKLERFGVPPARGLAEDLMVGLLSGWGAAERDLDSARHLMGRAWEESGE